MRLCKSPSCRVGFVAAMLFAASACMAIPGPTPPPSDQDGVPGLVHWLKIVGGPAIGAGAAFGTWLSGKKGAAKGAGEAVDARFKLLNDTLEATGTAIEANGRANAEVARAVGRALERIDRHERDEEKALGRLEQYHELLDDRVAALERRRTDKEHLQHEKERRGLSEPGEPKDPDPDTEK